MMPDPTNINTLWTSVIIEELTRLGVSQFMISPGSRSAPLTVAAARHKRTNCVVHYDERGAAFCALGYARATGRPAALICTSGTAIANYLPAVVEASVDCVPIIILTADRPPELRGRGANQTITQPGIYGNYVRWGHDLECPTSRTALTEVLRIVDDAVRFACESPAGPVHLNCMFREPLAPIASTETLEEYASTLDTWARGEQPHALVTRAARGLSHEELAGARVLLESTQQGLIVAGALKSENDRRAVASLSERLGWPLLADFSSGLRGGEISTRIDFFDLALASKMFADKSVPNTVLQFGARLTSKRLLQFLELSAPENYIQILDHPFVHDPINRVTMRLQADIQTACLQLAEGPAQPRESKWLARWKGASQAVDALLEATFAQSPMLTESLLASLLASELDVNDIVWVASSMPIRSMDVFASPRAPWYTVGANRGASGIDGTIASAAGFALGFNRSVVLLVGDLAMLHDLNSLSLLRDPGVRVTVVIINNNGGGIFGHLPIADTPELFEKYFVTPHGYRFAEVARMFQLQYEHVENRENFVEALHRAKAAPGSNIIEVMIDRDQSWDMHRNLVQAAANKVDQRFSHE